MSEKKAMNRYHQFTRQFLVSHKIQYEDFILSDQLYRYEFLLEHEVCNIVCQIEIDGKRDICIFRAMLPILVDQDDFLKTANLIAAENPHYALGNLEISTEDELVYFRYGFSLKYGPQLSLMNSTYLLVIQSAVYFYPKLYDLLAE